MSIHIASCRVKPDQSCRPVWGVAVQCSMKAIQWGEWNMINKWWATENLTFLQAAECHRTPTPTCRQCSHEYSVETSPPFILVTSLCDFYFAQGQGGSSDILHLALFCFVFLAFFLITSCCLRRGGEVSLWQNVCVKGTTQTQSLFGIVVLEKMASGWHHVALKPASRCALMPQRCIWVELNYRTWRQAANLHVWCYFLLIRNLLKCQKLFTILWYEWIIDQC